MVHLTCEIEFSVSARRVITPDSERSLRLVIGLNNLFSQAERGPPVSKSEHIIINHGPPNLRIYHYEHDITCPPAGKSDVNRLKHVWRQ